MADLLLAKLTNDGSTRPKNAAVFVPFKGRNKDLGRGTQEPETVNTTRVDHVLEALACDRLGDVLYRPKDV